MSEMGRLFDLACDLPLSQREAALRAASADADLIAYVLALLDVDAATRTRAHSSVNAMVAQFVSTELNEGDVVGAWRLVREIGRGGMGAVFFAERADGHFKQQAAIKLIRGLADPDTAAHFARERQLLANLQHPQIARLLDGGSTPGGAPYLVMEYIEGVPLDEWCMHEGLDERLRIFVSICKTLQFAHQQLIVHCDLKPSNVLVRKDGTPVLLDFGIARAVDRADGASAGMSSHLTPRYASPEQTRGEAPTIVSDIYSLGLLLYGLIAGSVPGPFDKDHPAALSAPSASAADMPWRRRLQGDLDAIVGRACSLDPTRRYPSALTLAQDIERIARHEPVSARPRTPLYVGTKLLRRRWPAFATGALLLTLGAAYAMQYIAQVQAIKLERDRAQAITRYTQSLFDDNSLGLGGDGTTVREMLDRGSASVLQRRDLQPSIKGALLLTMARAYNSLTAGHQAQPLLDAARPLLALADPAERAEFAATEGYALYLQLHFSGAMDRYREALELLRSAPGDHRDELISLRLKIDMVHWNELDVPIGQTIADLTDIVAELETAPQHSDGLLLRALANLAECHAFAFDTAGALPIAERAMQLAERAYGTDSNNLSIPRHALGLALIDQHPRRAADIFAGLAADYDRYTSKPGLGRNLNLYYEGIALYYAGELAEAARLLDQVAAMQHESGGPTDLLRLMAIEQLGLVHNRAGEPEKTRALIEPALPEFATLAREGNNGARANAAWALAILGEAERSSGRYDEAALHLAEADAVLSKLDPDGVKDLLLDTLEWTVRLRIDQRDYAKAQTALDRYGPLARDRAPNLDNRAAVTSSLQKKLDAAETISPGRR